MQSLDEAALRDRWASLAAVPRVSLCRIQREQRWGQRITWPLPSLSLAQRLLAASDASNTSAISCGGAAGFGLGSAINAV